MNFPQFVVVHTVKGYDIVSEAEVDVFLELSWFFYDATNVGNLISDLYLFKIQLKHLEALSSCSVEV